MFRVRLEMSPFRVPVRPRNENLENWLEMCSRIYRVFTRRPFREISSFCRRGRRTPPEISKCMYSKYARNERLVLQEAALPLQEEPFYG